MLPTPGLAARAQVGGAPGRDGLGEPQPVARQRHQARSRPAAASCATRPRRAIEAELAAMLADGLAAPVTRRAGVGTSAPRGRGGASTRTSTARRPRSTARVARRAARRARLRATARRSSSRRARSRAARRRRRRAATSAPDGRNINDGCGSTYPDAACSARCASAGADAGLAFDGDADRVRRGRRAGRDRRRRSDHGDRRDRPAGRGQLAQRRDRDDGDGEPRAAARARAARHRRRSRRRSATATCSRRWRSTTSCSAASSRAT